MSLINDALKRASQTEKNRPRPAASATGMEPTPMARGSRLTTILLLVVVVALLLAGWFFWQWWMARNNLGGIHVVNNAAPTTVAHTSLQPVATPKAAPVAVAATVNPVPVPAAKPVVAAPVVSSNVPSTVANFRPTPWPVDLKLGGIFYNKTNAHALINGNLCGVGDDIQSVVVKEIDKDKVTVEWNGHTRVLLIGGP